jgi:CRISPR/Cas system CSM-associated protein Csm2 small subunit
MRLPKFFYSGKSRKYPIKRDKEGLSLRARCFELFEQGKRPVAVAEELKMKETTVCRYFRDWKLLGPNFEQKYEYVQSLFKKSAADRDKNIELFANAWGLLKEQLETVLSQPHGLRRLLTRKSYSPAEKDADHKRHVSLELASLISNHLSTQGGKYIDIYSALKRYLQEYKNYRQEEDAEIEEWNKVMEFIHAILAADMENERKGRVQPDTFSEEERNAIIRLGIEAETKNIEILYWLRIGSLMAERLTTEQAREKIYQDCLEKGDLKRAKMVRAFQDKVHPLKTNDQIPPLTPPQTPSLT